MKLKIRESDVVKSIKDYLTLKGILVIRMGTGSFPVGEGKNRRYFKTGLKGCADLVCFTSSGNGIFWIEAKSSTGKQSPDQKIFQSRVEKLGHIYIIARSLDDVIPLFEKGRSK